jgi:hypothetical protein
MDRRFLPWLGPPLLIATVWSVYKVGQVSLWVAAPLMLLLVWNIARTDDRKLAEEMEAWRKTSGKRKARVVSESYRNPAVIRKDAAAQKSVPNPKAGYRDAGRVKVATNGVVAPPWELLSLVEVAGGGHVAGTYQLLPKLAYVFAVEADGLSSSDFVAVVAKLEAKHVQVLVRPRTPDDATTGPAVITKDTAFRDAFWVECADVKAARDLLSEGLRETLRELKDCWLFVHGDAMALVRYGRIDAARVHALVAGADEIFAEIGADGGPSLLGENDADQPSGKLAPARA